jgi:hypothetical protein
MSLASWTPPGAPSASTWRAGCRFVAAFAPASGGETPLAGVDVTIAAGPTAHDGHANLWRPSPSRISKAGRREASAGCGRFLERGGAEKMGERHRHGVIV